MLGLARFPACVVVIAPFFGPVPQSSSVVHCRFCYMPDVLYVYISTRLVYVNAQSVSSPLNKQTTKSLALHLRASSIVTKHTLRTPGNTTVLVHVGFQAFLAGFRVFHSYLDRGDIDKIDSTLYVSTVVLLAVL